MNSFCFARDDKDGRKEYRKVHKPVPGLYDGKKITTCAWCGKEFERQVRQIKKGQERFYCCRSHQVRDQQRRIARYLNLAERRPVKPEVVGSSPTRAAKFRIVIRP